LGKLRFIVDINKVDTKYGNFVLIELMRINTVTKGFLMLKLLYTKSDVVLPGWVGQPSLA
jgi:hypothetical protein